MVTTRAFALRDAGECYACQMLFEGGRFRCRPPFLFLHTKRPAPGAEAQPRCRSFYTVAPAGVEPAMGESKSPALPLGDGASCKILYHILCFSTRGRLHFSAFAAILRSLLCCLICKKAVFFIPAAKSARFVALLLRSVW